MLKKYEQKMYLILNTFKEESFKEKRLKIYNNIPNMLDILEIYAIEEIFRLGSKGYFYKLMSCKGEDLIIDTDNTPEWIYSNDYRYWIMDAIADSIYCRTGGCVGIVNSDGYIYNRNMHGSYDLGFFTVRPVVELYKSALPIDDEKSTDDGIKRAIINTAVSVGINEMMKDNSSSIEGIKQRQLSKGVFSDMDKKYLIDIISSHPGNFKSIEKLAMTFYPIAKQFIDDNNGDEVLNNLFGFDVTECRTNITGEDVFGKKDKQKLR